MQSTVLFLAVIGLCIVVALLLYFNKWFIPRRDNPNIKDGDYMLPSCPENVNSSQCLTTVRDWMASAVKRKCGVTLVLHAGTLLGYIRTGQGIEGDDDIDFLVWVDEMQKVKACIQELGFEISIDHPGFFNVNATVRHPQIDFYAIHRPEAGIICSLWDKVMMLEADVLPPVDATGYDFKLPRRPENLLVQWYGDNWRVPRKYKTPCHFTHPLCYL